MGSSDLDKNSQMTEISGWDTNENFFVEKAVLRCHQNGSNVDLRTQLRTGSLVFVRLLNAATMDRTMPVTYEVSDIHAGKADNGSSEVSLTRLLPKEIATRTLLQFEWKGLPN